MEFLKEIWDVVMIMIIIEVFIAIIVLIAMSCDFVSGLYKAKLRGEATRSKAMQKTVTKFLCYEGAIIIAGCIDIMIAISQIMTLLDLPLLRSIPLVTILMGIFIMGIEIRSIKEKANEKEQKYISDALSTISTLVGKEDLIRLLTNKIKSE